MKISSLEVDRNTFNIALDEIDKNIIKRYLKGYFKTCFLLGFKEKLIKIETSGEQCKLCVTFTKEEVSKYILKNLINDIDNIDKVFQSAINLIKEGFTQDIIKKAEDLGFKTLELSEELFQINFGKNSIAIGEKYQSYENMIQVYISKDRKSLRNNFDKSDIPLVKGKVIYSIDEIEDIKSLGFPLCVSSVNKALKTNISISDEDELKRVINNMVKMYQRVFVYSGNVNYRIICFKGEAGLVFKKEDKFRKIDIASKKLEVIEAVEVINKLKSFCEKVYNIFPIEFMYIDIEDDEEFKIIDLGSVFDVEDEIKDIKDEIIEYFLLKLQNGFEN